MSQHGNRAERHAAEIHKNVNSEHAEFGLEQAKQRQATEDYNENSRHERHTAERFETNKD